MNMAEGSEGTASPKWSTQEVIEVDDYEDVAKEALSERLDEPEPVPPRHATPPLPLSPISNPATPPRKRQRTAKWSPPPHIPAFLPPFPTDTPRPTPTPPPQELPTSFPVSPLKVERPTSPIPELSPSSSSADYLTPTPYTLSSLSNQVVWHPPTKPSSPPMPTGRLPLPQVQPALFGAYHHVLTHPPPPQVTSINPGRYKVALALLSQADTSPRWDPPPTLFANTAPNAPRVAPMPPSHAIPIGHNPPGKESKEGKDKDKAKESEVDPKLPTAFPRPVGAIERVAPLLSQQSTRIPGLARLLLPVRSFFLPWFCSELFNLTVSFTKNSVHTRTTRLGHPPVLSRGAQKLTYGPGVNAIWNSGPTIASTPAPLPGGKPPKEADGKDGQLQKVLVDARMYATWNYEEKHYKEPLVVGRRARMGSLQIGVGGVSNGIAVGGVGLARARSQSKG